MAGEHRPASVGQLPRPGDDRAAALHRDVPELPPRITVAQYVPRWLDRAGSTPVTDRDRYQFHLEAGFGRRDDGVWGTARTGCRNRLAWRIRNLEALAWLGPRTSPFCAVSTWAGATSSRWRICERCSRPAATGGSGPRCWTCARASIARGQVRGSSFPCGLSNAPEQRKRKAHGDRVRSAVNSGVAVAWLWRERISRAPARGAALGRSRAWWLGSASHGGLRGHLCGPAPVRLPSLDPSPEHLRR